MFQWVPHIISPGMEPEKSGIDLSESHINDMGPIETMHQCNLDDNKEKMIHYNSISSFNASIKLCQLYCPVLSTKVVVCRLLYQF